MKNSWVFVGVAGVLVLFAACKNPFSNSPEFSSVDPEVPVISVQPLGAEYFVGDEAADLTVTAHTGDKGILSYRWYRTTEDSNEGGTLIEGETETTYTPAVDTAGTVYYYVIVTNTLNKKTAVVVSDTAAVMVYEIEEGTTVINNAAVTVTAPTKGGIPGTAATADGAGYTCGTVSWNPGDNPFLGGTVYTATVTLTADDGYVFAPGLAATINHHHAEVSHYTVNTVTLSLSFNATLTKTVTGIAIKHQPVKLAYTHGDALDLSGLAVTLTHDDNTSEEIALNGFGTNILTEPEHGAALSHTDHNGRPVAVSFGALEPVYTENLTVNRAVVSSITFPTAGAVTYGAALSASELSGGSGGGSFAWADGTIIPTMNNSGYDVEFTPGDTVNYDYSGVSGWNSGAGKVVRTVSVVVNSASIANVEVTVTGPAKGATPDTVASGTGNFSIGTVSWNPDDNPFLGGIVYTATVTLTADETYIFAENLTAKINDTNATVTSNTGTAVTLSLTFDATLLKTVSAISIKTQPTVNYTHGDTLDLDGLAVTLTFDDGTNEDVEFAHFWTTISTSPANGITLSHAAHNGNPVAVTFGNVPPANTHHLTVNPKALTVTGAAHTKPYDGTITAAGVTVTLTGIAGSDDVSVDTVTAEYTNTNAGTQTVNITDVTLTGSAAENYTVTLPAGATTVTGGITKANPAVTWPTAATITYGAALSTSALTGGTGNGSFAWTNGAAIPTVTNSGYEVTFTPTDTVNYTTLTQNVSITVTTLQTIPTNRVEYYWVNEQDVITTTSNGTGNDITLPRGETLTITANGNGYSNQRWYINGAEDKLQTGNGTYSFSSGEKDAKRYTVTLIVEKGGKYYNANFMVTVTE